jgi:hypothetical protein
MTMGTAILGMLPICISSTQIGGNGPPYYPMARAIVGGLIFSTLVTLALMPTIYAVLDDWRENVRALFRQARAPRRRRGAIEATGRSHRPGVVRTTEPTAAAILAPAIHTPSAVPMLLSMNARNTRETRLRHQPLKVSRSSRNWAKSPTWGRAQPELRGAAEHPRRKREVERSQRRDDRGGRDR